MKSTKKYSHNEVFVVDRQPLKRIQASSCSNISLDMAMSNAKLSKDINYSSKRICPNQTVDSLQNRSSVLNKQQRTINRVSALTKSTICDTKTLNRNSCAITKSPSPERCRKKHDSSYSLNRVQSLMSSPKWSRIKDKFESGELTKKQTDSVMPCTTNAKTTNLKKSSVGNNVVTFHKDNIISSRTTNHLSKVPHIDAKTNLQTSSTMEKSTNNIPISARSVATTLLPGGGSRNLRKSVANIKKENCSSNDATDFISSPLNSKNDTVMSDPTKVTCGVRRLNASGPSSRGNSPNSTSRTAVRSKMTSRSQSPSVCSSTDTLSSNGQVKITNRTTPLANAVKHANKHESKITVTSKTKKRWVKDEAGNWTKADVVEETNFLRQNKDQSTISTLKTKRCSLPLEKSNRNVSDSLLKSKTTSNVPNDFNNKLSKSSTCSSVLSQRVENSELCRSSIIRRSLDSAKLRSSNSSSSSSSLRSDGSNKISVVQRAVLSYEGNLSILSPETQRKLKLLGEKVKAQEEDDNLFLSKFKKNNGNSTKVSMVSEPMDAQTKNEKTYYTDLGEPLQPIRSFLSRYQNMYKCKKDKTNEFKNTLKNNEDVTHSLSALLNNQSSLYTYCNPLNTNGKLDTSSVNVKSDRLDSTMSDRKTSASEDAKNASDCPNVNVKELTQKFKTEDKTTNPNKNQIPKNSSFLFHNTEKELSKDAVVNFTDKNGCRQKYYTVENFEKYPSRNNEENAFVRDTAGEACYQNIPNNKNKTDDEDWMDMSDDETHSNKTTSSKSSTLRRKNKRYSHYKGQLHKTWSQSFKDMLEANSSKRNSQISLNNIDTTNSIMDDGTHIYEPVYESLGDYLICSPDGDTNKDVNSSYTSLESLQSDKESAVLPQKTAEIISKKKRKSKIGQLRRHLSWTKSDIKLELSSKFNKIKIKKNANNQTEIGVRVQDNGSASTSPKKNTFIKCILKQKSSSSLTEEPLLKKSPSPKKESATFYVHLSMMREKQRPYSDSCIQSVATKDNVQQKRKTSEPSALSSLISKPITGRYRKASAGQLIQRPKTPPPLPPTSKINPEDKAQNINYKDNLSSLNKTVCKSNSLRLEKSHENNLQKNMGFASHKKGDTFPISQKDQNHFADYENDLLDPIYASIEQLDSVEKRNSFASSASYDSSAMTYESGSSGTSTSTTYSSGFSIHISDSDVQFNRKTTVPASTNDLSLPLVKIYKNELLRSPFEEEPLYQFYHKDVQQRATMWYSADGSESEFDDYSIVKRSAEESSRKPHPLHSQTSAMDLIRTESGQRTLWSEVPEVRDSGILERIPPLDRKVQEAMFEVITSEASYQKSLNFLLEHFAQCAEFSAEGSRKIVLDKREKHILFSDIQPVRDVSASLLADLEKRWLENIVLSDVCDIVYKHACKYFSVYVKYCSNQIYQDRTLKQLKETRPQFVEVLKKLESHPLCQGLDMHSFLILPMQRITRLPLLVDAIFHRLPIESPIYESCKMALALLNKLVAECNEGTRKMERMEEMLVISHHLDFKDCKGLGLLTASRWLVKKGEIIQLVADSTSKRTFGRNLRWCKVRLFLYLFTDLFIITKKKSKDSYCVLDYCPRNMVQVATITDTSPLLPARLPSSCQNIFQLILLSNSKGKTAEMFLSCFLESDHTRWLNVLTPTKSENPDEKIYEKWDCPQVQCIEAYTAEQPDELSMEEADVINVFRKLADGWYEGERIRDGVRGWFPSSRTKEIISSHVRARNLRQRYRLLMLSQAYLEYKASLAKAK